MKEMFDWVPWFNELANKIADGGRQYLDDRAKEVKWQGASPLSNVDVLNPLLFITVVANESEKAESRDRVFANLAEVFEIRPLQTADSRDVWHFPRCLRLFQYDNPDDPANRDVVWRLLRATVSGSLDAETFESANGRLRNISWAKLTTTLALIDAASHLRFSKGYPEAYGVAKVVGEPRWTDYQSRITEARANFPGCELYEIEMFARLQSSTNEGGQSLAAHRDRCWIATTNASWRDQVGNDHTSEFRENHWLRVENSSEYPVEQPEPGDVMLARYGRDKGRGIGVVYRNDYGQERNPEGRIHVLWLNKRQCDFERPIQARAFAEASESVRTAFRQRAEYLPTWNVLEGVGRKMALWSRFLEVWPPDRVRDMSLEEYTNVNRSDAFVYWLEKRTEALGSIWGGSAFKFGIYRRARTDAKEPGGGRIFGDKYAWMDKYGETEEEAFASVRTRLTDVIDAARTGNLEAIDKIDFSPAVKWKVAFLYQNRKDAGLLAIYKEGRLAARYKEAFPEEEEPPPSQQHAALITHYSWLGGVLDISRRLWLDPKEQTPPEPPDDRPKACHPRNQILYGPPGTGKTYETVSHALAVVDGVDVDKIREDRKEEPEAVLKRYSKLRFKSPGGAGGRPEGRLAMVTFHQNYAYEDFVEGIRPKLAKAGDDGRDLDSATSESTELAYELRHGIFRSMCEVADNARRKAREDGGESPRYVLVIDEINRGNIPKIFGELITLIEPSRRLGADNKTTVTLPYSGDDFGVPDNLYIIGTMNTADRSIQQMDTALRRRFTFVEMMPDAKHDLIWEDVEGVNCRRMLRAMNERIALLLDREHQIGHTYLLKVETMEQLADTFRNRIFPLLQEYFYDDWRKIRAVLGNNAFVRERRLDDPGTRALAEQFGHAEDDRVYERLSFSNDEWKNSEQYERIYSSPKED